jgi:hypothetical protein
MPNPDDLAGSPTHHRREQIDAIHYSINVVLGLLIEEPNLHVYNYDHVHELPSQDAPIHDLDAIDRPARQIRD